MPADDIFHKGNTLAFHRIENDGGGFPGCGFGTLDRLVDGGDVVTVDRLHKPPESSQLLDVYKRQPQA